MEAISIIQEMRTKLGITDMEGENVTDSADTFEIETAKCGDQMYMEDIKVRSILHKSQAAGQILVPLPKRGLLGKGMEKRESLGLKY